ncbi:MAG: bacillithiol system redox-active protein YtxJ [Acidobacteria bacterium]|nr:MAG: bacillithiol system redox-active protein YtxJ [Acidobacteriota bacterium]
MWGGMNRICYPEIMVIELRQDRDLEQLVEISKSNPVLIFKHSTQCSISSQAYDEFRQFAESASELACGLILVIENPAISDAIAKRFKVRHESPQVIFIKDGRAAWHASHWSITIESLNEALRRHGQPAHQRN